MKKYSFILFVLLLPNISLAASPKDAVSLPVYKIYQLGSSFEKLLKNNKDETSVKNQLKVIIKSITAGDLRKRWLEFIDNTPISSTFYRTVFESMTPRSDLKIESTDIGFRKSTVKAKLEVTEMYAPSIDMITLEELFAKYKITNMTVVDIVNMLPTSSLAELVEYKINSQRLDILYLMKVDGAWKIKKIDNQIISSTIEVKLPKAPKKE